MNKNPRFENLIGQTVTIFEMLQASKGVVDQGLKAYFRANKKHGSKDRKLIQGAIYGFYRFQGWIQKMGLTAEESLFYGYILENHEITKTILYWNEKLGYPSDFLQRFECPEATTLEKRLETVQVKNPEITMEDLNPSFYGKLELETIRALQTRAGLWLRLNRESPGKLFAFLKEKQVPYLKHPTIKNALLVQGTINLMECEAYKKGQVEVQDFTSQLIGHIAAPKKGSAWLDFCCGAGGKALHLASLMENQGQVLGLDIREKALKEADQRAERAKLKCLQLGLWDGIELPEEVQKKWDGVLVDAPCSCSGTVRRTPDLRWKLTEEKVQEYQNLQLSILKKADQTVPAGGLLLYATCSLLKAENQDVVAKFLRDHNYELEAFTDPISGEETSGEKLYLPPETEGDAMFIAKLRKKVG